MKKCTLIIELMLLSIVSSCGGYELESNSKENSYQLKIHIKNTEEADIAYPLSIYLFDQKEVCTLQQEIATPDEELTLSLPENDYDMIVFSGLSGQPYTVPSDIRPTANLSLNQEKYTTLPLLSGKSHIKLNDDSDTKFSLSYSSAAVQFAFSGIPEEATEVSVQLSPISSGISFNGDYTNDDRHCNIPCHKENDLWKAGPVYILPSESSRTYLTINIQTPELEKIYSYTYHQPLEPGQPYNFSGSCTEEGVTLEGEFEIEGWRPAIDIEFTFDEPGKPEENNPSDDNENTYDPSDTETIYSTNLPVSESIWGPFYVWEVKKLSAEEVLATLISPEQWILLASEAQTALDNYEEEGFTGWRTFTRKEAEAFRDQYDDQLPSLNLFLSENGMSRFYYEERERYLCSQADSTFSFHSNSRRILKAGATVKYYLRGVKTIKVKQK